MKYEATPTTPATRVQFRMDYLLTQNINCLRWYLYSIYLCCCMADSEIGTSGVCLNYSMGRSSMKLRGSSHQIVPGMLMFTMNLLRARSRYLDSGHRSSLNSSESFKIIDFSSSSPYRSISVLNLLRAEVQSWNEQFSGSAKAANIFWFGVSWMMIRSGSMHSGQSSLNLGISPQQNPLSFSTRSVSGLLIAEDYGYGCFSMGMPKTSSSSSVVRESESRMRLFLSPAVKGWILSCKNFLIGKLDSFLIIWRFLFNQLQQRPCDQAHGCQLLNHLGFAKQKNRFPFDITQGRTKQIRNGGNSRTNLKKSYDWMQQIIEMEYNFVPPVVKRSFEFPQSLKQFEKGKSLVGIQAIMAHLCQIHPAHPKMSQLKFQQVKKEQKNKGKTVQNFYLTVSCLLCSAYIIFSKQIRAKYYRVVEAQTKHQHNFQAMHIFKQVMKMIKMPSFKYDKLRQFCCDNFELTPEQMKVVEFYLNYETKKKTLAGFIEISRQKHIIKIYPSNNKINPKTHEYYKSPSFIFLASFKKVQLYNRFGRIVYLHRFPFLVKKSNEDKQDWFVLVFSTKNSYGNIIFLGFVVCCGLTAEHISVSFYVFFEKFDPKVCESIVTEEDDIFLEGVQKFRKQSGFKGEHLWDKMLEIKEIVEKRRKVFSQLILVETVQQFDSILAVERKEFKGDEAIKLESFRKRSCKYCFSQIPETFIGLGIGVNNFTDILNLISVSFPVEKELRSFVPQFFNFIQTHKVERYEQKPIKCPQIPFLGQLSFLIPELPLKFLQNRVLQLSQCNIISHENNKIKLQKNIVLVCKKIQKEHKPKQNKTTAANRQIQQDSNLQSLLENQELQNNVIPEKINLLCDCLIKVKTGLPCAHILRVCFHYGIPLLTQIDEYWLCKQPQKIEKEGDSSKVIAVQQ